jgi:hypothetical protein
MNLVSFRAFARRALLPLVIGAVVLGPASETHANPSNIQVYSFNATNNTGTTSDNARFSAFGWAPPNLPTAPDWIPPAFSSTFWPVPASTTTLLFRHLTWTGGGAIPAGNTRWFQVKIRVLPSVGPSTYFSFAWLRWNFVSGTAGAPIPLGFKISSPPVLFNASDSPYGGANTANMVVRGIRFANSPYAIATDSLRLDNSTVLARFAESLDATRAGPFTVAPGDTFRFNDIHPSILDTSPGARTILVRGTTEDWNGAQHDFVVQFILPLGMPASSKLGLLLLALLLATMGTVYLARTRALQRRPST